LRSLIGRPARSVCTQVLLLALLLALVARASSMAMGDRSSGRLPIGPWVRASLGRTGQ
jgi:hypothetical protein